MSEKEIKVFIKQKTISVKRLISLTNEYWKDGGENPAWTPQDRLHVLNYMRFLEKRLSGRTLAQVLKQSNKNKG